MSEQMEVPNWIVNQIGKLTLENELLKAENATLRSMLSQQSSEQETSEE